MRLTVGNYAQDANNCIDVICNDEVRNMAWWDVPNGGSYRMILPAMGAL